MSCSLLLFYVHGAVHMEDIDSEAQEQLHYTILLST